MADFTYKGLLLDRGDLVRPAVGAWHAEVYFAAPDAAVAVGDYAALSVLGTELWGTVAECGSEALLVRALLVGGRGRLDQELPPEEWRGAQAGQIAQECLAEAGEVAGGGWDLAGAYCPRWKRSQGPLRGAMRRLSRLWGAGGEGPADLRWRVLPDGSVGLADDGAWPTLSGAAQDADIWPQQRCAALWPLTGEVGPGRTVECFGTGRRVERSQYVWTGSDARVLVWYR